MSETEIYTALSLISLIAFFLKGVMGTGTGTVMMAMATFVIDPKLAVVIAAFTSIFSGLLMLPMDRGTTLPPRFWMPVAAVMVAGSAAGAMSLRYVPTDIFKVILGTAFLLAGLWFGLRRKQTVSSAQAPKIASKTDLGVGLFSGYCGGFIGVNASPLIIHFGRYLDKRHLRRLLVLIFIPAAVVQTATFMANGLFTREALIYTAVMLPGMGLGIWIGNRSHARISEEWFARALAVFLVIVSLRLIWQGVVS